MPKRVRRKSAPNRPCPQCGNGYAKRIVWTEDPAQLAAAQSGTAEDAGVAFLKGPARWNDTLGPDRVCPVCEQRFCNDPADQAKHDEDTARQKRRMEAMKRGDYMMFDVNTTSVDEIAATVFRRIQSAKKDGRAPK